MKKTPYQQPRATWHGIASLQLLDPTGGDPNNNLTIDTDPDDSDDDNRVKELAQIEWGNLW